MLRYNRGRPEANAFNDLFRQASTDSDLLPSVQLIHLWLLVEESAAANSTLESKSKTLALNMHVLVHPKAQWGLDCKLCRIVHCMIKG